MAYPPPVPPANRTDATVMATNHAADHNATSLALTEILNHMATLEASIYPIGTITMSGSDIPPGNHELCRGQEVSKTTYPEVFSLIGTKFGPGTASTFTMPNFQGRSAMGFWAGGPYANVLGGYPGRPDSTLPVHDHRGADHLHQLGTLAVAGVANHWHQPSNGGSFVVGGPTVGVPPQGWLRDAVISLGAGAYEEIGGTGDAGAHTHALTGFPGVADRDLTTTPTGTDPSNTNIHPVTSVNFIMRMH